MSHIQVKVAWGASDSWNGRSGLKKQVPNGPPGQALENGEGLSNRLMFSHVACYMRRQRHFDPGIQYLLCNANLS